MRTITLEKTFWDEKLGRVFVQNISSREKSSLKEAIFRDVSASKTSVCAVFDQGLNEDASSLLLEGNAQKYLIVPNIDEAKYSGVKGRAVVHEVPDAKGNYVLIDGETLYLFDPQTFFGIKVTDRDTVRTVMQVFKREFWLHTENEFIEKKLPMAEITFDLPPVCGNDHVLLDEGFGERTPLSALLADADDMAFSGEVDPTAAAKMVVLKDPASNRNYLETVGQDVAVSLWSDLPFSAAMKDGIWYALAFDPKAYGSQTGEERGRPFAVRLDGFVEMGETYSFQTDVRIADVLGKKVLSIDGKEIEIREYAERSRSVTADLRIARELANADDDMKEARLEKLNGNIFDRDGVVGTVLYTVEIKLPKQKMTKRAAIYETYKKTIQKIGEKVREIFAIGGEALDEAIRDRLNKKRILLESIRTAEDLSKCQSEINEIVETLNATLLEEKKKTVGVLSLPEISLSLPQYGTLYEEKKKYEYVLRDEQDLDAAMAEMKLHGIAQQDVAYLLE